MAVKVSIIIPAYNRKEKLKQAIESVVAQTVKDWELWVIDDCSEEDIEAVVKQFEQLPVYYKRLSQKGNANISRNLGANLANGKYVAYLDSDDSYMPSHLQSNLSNTENKECIFFYGGAKIYDGKFTFIWNTRQIMDYEFPLNFLLNDGFAQTSTYFLSKERVLKQPWDETLNRHQDYDFFLRQCALGLPQAIHDVTVSIDWSGSRNYQFADSIRFIEKHEDKLHYKAYSKYLIEMLKKANSTQSTYSKYYIKKLNNYLPEVSMMDYLNHYPGNKKTGAAQYIFHLTKSAAFRKLKGK